MVYSPLQAAAKFFQYYLHASNSKGHGTHSPFVYEFITKVMNDFSLNPKRDEDYEKAEGLRKQLLKDKTEIVVTDFGAGSGRTKSDKRSIAAIARHAAKPKKFGQLLYRIIQHYKCNHVLELGTSLGITTSYLSLANPGATVMTMEGAETIASAALKNFQQLGLQNIEIIRGNFDDTLALALQKMPIIDFAFIDGNHRQEPTENYFHQLLPHVHNNTIIVVDDIHWSRGMEAAWKNIVNNELVTCDVDLFWLGIISFRKEFKEKQQFSLRF